MQDDTGTTASEPVPWAMQLVAHVERTDPPSHTAVCEAAAIACVTLLADERSAAGGPWHPFVTRWRDERIRKHARRARGGEWRKAQEPDGVTVTWRGADVRAYVPSAVDAIPLPVRRLQLQGFELDDTDRTATVEPDGVTVIVAITPDPPLPTGKAAAAAAHAAQLAREAMTEERRTAWAAAGFPVAVEHPEPPRWHALLGTAPVVVRDGGFTVVAPGTVTALARW